MRDLKYAMRMLARAPGFSAIAILTLALGIGANTAIFSVTNAVVLRSLPLPNPQQLVYLRTSEFPGSQTGYGDLSLSLPVYEQMRAQRQVFSDVVAFVPLATSSSTAVRFGSQPSTADGEMVSGNFFTGLGVRMVRGRSFTLPDEDRHSQVAVLSDAYWSARFARNPDVLGQTLFVKGVPFTIIGVSAAGFIGIDQGRATDFWIPFQDRPELNPWGATRDAKLYGDPQWWFLMEMGRLQPGIRPARAVAELQPIFRRTAYAGLAAPGSHQPVAQLSLTPARGIEGLRQSYEQPLAALMIMVGLVLVIACANVAVLFVERNAARQREFSLRLALGGSHLRLFRQLLTEGLLLVAAGAGLGWLFAEWATRALAAWSQLDVGLAPDRRVLGFTLAISLAAALAFGLAPLRGATRIPLGMALRTSAASSGRDRSQLRGGQIVTVLQIALCLALLVCGGILVRTLRNLENANLGIKTQGLLVFGVTPRTHTPADTLLFYQQLLDRMRRIPGVESATLMQNRIGSGWSNNNTAWVDGVRPPGTNAPLRSNEVGPDFFHTLGTPTLAGRDFNDNDTAAAPKVAIVNQTFVQRYLGGRVALGHQVGRAPDARTIVGVVADSKYTSADEAPRPMAYYPYTQTGGQGTMHVELRSDGGASSALLPAVRRAMRDFAPDLPLLHPMTQRAQFEESFSQQRLVARLAMFFGLLAAVLVATGLYGTLAYKVTRRTAEIGVRMALGARPRQVLWMILRESLGLTALGVALGLPLAFTGAYLLQSALYGVGPYDWLTFSLAVIGLTAIAMAASSLPARRAAAVDPLIALRWE